MKKLFRWMLVCIAVALLPLHPAGALPAGEETQDVVLTEAERRYVEEHPVVRVDTIAGIAPIAYFEKGEMRGITRGVLDHVADCTGLQFDCGESESVEALLSVVREGGVDIVAGVPSQYMGKELIKFPVSPAYLAAQAVLFVRNDVDASRLTDRVYACVSGGALPKDVNPAQVVYYDTREQALNAIEKGEADYCYANEFSISYYTIKNGYRNAVSIPQNKEYRAYRMIYINADPLLKSIINKALASIKTSDLQLMILESASKIERKITLPMVLYTYGLQLAVLSALIVAVLVAYTVLLLRAKQRSSKQMRRYMLLSEVSDEYIYEYDIVRDRLSLTAKCAELLGAKSEIVDYRRGADNGIVMSDGADLISGQMREVALDTLGAYRVVNSTILDRHGMPEFIIGKLIDISLEKKRLQALAVKAETDGLTGLYNAATTRGLIGDLLLRQKGDARSALLVFDIDRFKGINDCSVTAWAIGCSSILPGR